MSSADSLGPLPAVDPRNAVVDSARLELAELIAGLEKRHGLTAVEEYLILSRMLLSLSVDCYREERKRAKRRKQTDAPPAG